MRLHATYNQATKHVVATVARFDGNETHVWFDSPAAFRTWLEALEATLERDSVAPPPCATLTGGRREVVHRLP